MQQIETLHELEIEEQKRVDRVVETLTVLGTRGENAAELAHDARNMVTAIELYCDLLQEPGVLAPAFRHYSSHLRLVAAASRRLVDKLICIEAPAQDVYSIPVAETGAEPCIPSADQSHPLRNIPAELIANLAQDLQANRHLLAALAGPTIALTIDVQGGALPINMTGEDLTRIMVNLVKNSTEAMSGVGRIHITLWESCGDAESIPRIMLNVEDNGPGLSDAVLQRLFEPQHPKKNAGPQGTEWPVQHRGLGLAITRSVIERAGGMIHAANRDPVGACLQIELPVRRL